MFTLSIIDTVSGKGPDKNAISGLVDSFTNSLGTDNGNLPSQQGGFRKIRWDNNNIPFDIPRDYFASSRGLVFSNDKQNKFRVSNTGSDDKFDSINEESSQHFQTFSSNRLFAPLSDNIIMFQFYLPGTDVQAVVSGFGAVFVDV